MKQYKINEIFYSIQGEGKNFGKPMLFVRFSGCNLKCSFCDTDHSKFILMTAKEIYNKCNKLTTCKNICFTGGEPTLQLDDNLLLYFKDWYKTIETNGTKKVNKNINYIACSPKTDKKLIKADEYRYVIKHGDKKPINKNGIIYISPEFDGDILNNKNIDYCVNMVKNNPDLTLSLQFHKLINIK